MHHYAEPPEKLQVHRSAGEIPGNELWEGLFKHHSQSNVFLEGVRRPALRDQKLFWESQE